MIIKHLRIILVACALLVGIAAFNFIYQNDLQSARAVQADNVYGWAWSEHFGWISLNCFNYYDGNLTDRCAESTEAVCEGETCVDYGVNVDPETGVVTGYAWSSNHGWVDFDASGPYPQEPNHSVRLGNDGQLTGWAQVVNMGEDGWIHFGGEPCNETSATCLGIAGFGPFVLDNTVVDGQSSLCYNCNTYQKTCIGGESEGQACENSNQCGEGGSCSGDYIPSENGTLMCETCFSQSLPDPCLSGGFPDCLNKNKFPAGALCTQDRTIPQDQEYLCTDCVEVTDSTGTIISCGQCPQCFVHGVAVDYSSNRLVGWGWNSFGNGIGWINFTPSESHIAGPWLETQLGNVYSKGNIGSDLTFLPPDEKYSASYQIQAGGNITNFSTKSGETFVQEQFDNLDFPDQSTVYSNALGRIDFTGIEAGQYGEIEDITAAAHIDSILGGKVYVHEGDLTIRAGDFPTGIQFNPGTVSIPSGAGTVIVNGNLTIGTDIRYNENVPITRLTYLPSVAWIVKGDIAVTENVSHIEGAYIALGNGSDCPVLEQSSGGCGRFSTGITESQPLDVFGMVMAKQFNLQRLFYSDSRGAEQIIQDGRLIANPPPGLGDITQDLPIWRGIVPQ